MAGIGRRLLEAGFSPVATEPWQAGGFRTDHTPLLLEIAASFSDPPPPLPLRLFSQGPVFRPQTGRWIETVDVEWIGTVGPEQHRIMLSLADQLLREIADAGLLNQPAVLVLGHRGWIRKLGRVLGLEEDRVAACIRCWQEGVLSGSDAFPDATKALFQPSPAHTFFPALQEWLDVESPLSAQKKAEVLWDLSFVGSHPYYTGLVFSAYHPESGRELASGGEFALTVAGRRFEGFGFVLKLEGVGSHV
nr:ATP phosphoribosyltransferase regulatory subunit [Sulfobacillus harzensis]